VISWGHLHAPLYPLKPDSLCFAGATRSFRGPGPHVIRPLILSETVRDRGYWFQRTTKRNWPMGYQMVTYRQRHVTPKGQTRGNVSKTAG